MSSVENSEGYAFRPLRNPKKGDPLFVERYGQSIQPPISTSSFRIKLSFPIDWYGLYRLGAYFGERDARLGDVCSYPYDRYIEECPAFNWIWAEKTRKVFNEAYFGEVARIDFLKELNSDQPTRPEHVGTDGSSGEAGHP